MNKAIFTICSRNYLGQAKTLMDSVREFEPDATRYVVIVDKKVEEPEINDELAEVIWLEDLGISDFEYKALMFDVVEMNTNIKPKSIKLLLESCDHCIYLDPDTLLYSSLQPVWAALERSNVVVTPHLVYPESILNITIAQDRLRLGAFNLGFIAVSNSIESKRFLDWWDTHCINWGFNAPADGFFTDQKFIDHAHAYFNGIHVIRHLGLNVAYWNLHERALIKKDGRWCVGEDSLIFMHFSGFIYEPNPIQFDQISKYPTSVNLKERPEIRELFDDYRKRLKNNLFSELSKIQYSFAAFDNGVVVSRLARKLVAMGSISVDDQTNPFRSTGPLYRALVDARALDFRSVRRSPSLSRNKNHELKQLSVGLSVMRWILRRIGVLRYEALLKFMSYASSSINQSFIVKR